MIGELRERLAILSPRFDTNSVGDQIPRYRVTGYLWAEVLESSVGDTIAASQEQSVTATKFRVRRNPRLSGLKRLSWRGREYEIVGIEDTSSHSGTVALVAKCLSSA